MSENYEEIIKRENYEDICVDGKPAGERWDPLGAANDQEDREHSGGHFDAHQTFQTTDLSRIKSLEEEQEILTSSLLALTTHFAQVQFRLRQIVDAPINERDKLLKNLEEFAFRGIPEIYPEAIELKGDNIINIIENQRYRQHELIDQLKTQLTDLEKYAYENGDIVLPQSILIEKQKIIIDELKNKLNLNFDELDLKTLSTDLIRKNVDTAIGDRVVNPLKMKEQLVNQLKTQILDLERFIHFLQDETTKSVTCDDITCDNYHDSDYDNVGPTLSRSANPNRFKKKNSRENLQHNGDQCKCGNGQSGDPIDKNLKFRRAEEKMKKSTKPHASVNNCETGNNINNHAFGILSKATTLLQIFALTQFGCGTSHFQRNTLKKTTKGNHWGDIRARLEIDIQEIVSLQHQIDLLYKNHNTSRSAADAIKSTENYVLLNYEITSLVRKNFAITLKKLIQHGLHNGNDVNSIVPFIGCFTTPSQSANSNRAYLNRQHHSNFNSDDDMNGDYDKIQNLMHPWELILEYYHLKNGDKYNETPARKLSQSFNLDIVGGSALSNKQSLLSTIGTIIAIHHPYKRSLNAHFKAFVCAGLNSQKLVHWLNLIFQCDDLVSTYYTNWSYVSCTGFRDALKSMDRFNKYSFDLPVDLAIRQFQNMKDVFM